jgi:hypothetical protein
LGNENGEEYGKSGKDMQLCMELWFSLHVKKSVDIRKRVDWNISMRSHNVMGIGFDHLHIPL